MPSRTQFKSNEEYNAWHRSYRAKNAEKRRAYNRRYNAQWRKLHGFKSETESQRRYPQKTRARWMLAHAVKRGKLIRGSCQTCGKPNGQAHHDDYSKPLDVKWFCPLHHREYEDKMRMKNENIKHNSANILPTPKQIRGVVGSGSRYNLRRYSPL